MALSPKRTIDFEKVRLGEAAKREVGAGKDQLPDMSFFAADTSWFKLPSGHVVQIFSAYVMGADESGTVIKLPIQFPKALMSVSALWSDPTSAIAPTYKLNGYKSNVSQICMKISASAGSYGTLFIAIGY